MVFKCNSERAYFKSLKLKIKEDIADSDMEKELNSNNKNNEKI